MLCGCGPNNGNETVFRSTDSGNTFTDIGESFSNGVSSVLPDPLNSDVIYFTDSMGVVYRSKDSAQTWSVLTFPGSCSGTMTPPDLSTEGTLYYESPCSGFYASKDFGNTWTLLNGTFTEMLQFAQSPSDPLRMYASVNTCGSNGGSNCQQFFSSSDGGVAWSSRTASVEFCSGVFGCGGIAISPSNPDELYGFADSIYVASTNSWDFKVLAHSTDGGLSWSPVSYPTLYPVINSAPGYYMTSLQWLSNPSMLIGVLAEHLWQIPFDGSPWGDIDKGLAANFGGQIAIDPSSPATVYLAASNNSGISKSTDGGSTWKSTFNGTAASVAVDPFNSNHLLVGVPAGLDPLTYSNALQVSNDGGVTWSNGSASTGLSDLPTMILFDPTSRGTVYMSSQFGGISKSSDGGVTWSTITVGLSSPSVYSIALDPTNSQILIAGTGGGTYRSQDGGQTWSQTNSSIITSVSFDPNHAGVAYAAYKTLLKSTDHGNSWIDMTPVLSGSPYLNVIVDPKVADNLLVIASLDTVGWSPDGGKTWTWYQNVLPQTYFTVTGDFASVGGGISLPTVASSSPEVLYIPSMTSGIISLTMPQ